MSDLRELYQEVILDHSKNPRNYRKLEGANRTAEGYNPLCGDHFHLYLRMDGERIADISFEGSGCALSKASASMMTSAMKGKTAAEAESLFARFHEMIIGNKTGVIPSEPAHSKTTVIPSEPAPGFGAGESRDPYRTNGHESRAPYRTNDHESRAPYRTNGREGEGLGKLSVFSGVSEFPIRVKCVSLAWHTLTAALKGEQVVSTE